MAASSKQLIWFITGASRGFGLEIVRAAPDEMKRWRKLSLSTGFKSAA